MNLKNKERRTAVKKFLAASLFTLLSIPTATVDPIVKTVVKIFTFQMGF
jgi:fucose permease